MAKLLYLFIGIFILVRGEITLTHKPNYEHLQKCVRNITKTYAEKRTFVFLSGEVDNSDFMNSLLMVVSGPRLILSPQNLTHEEGFFIFLAQKNKAYSKILEHLIYFENSRFLLIWIEPETSILYLRGIFQEFWSHEMLDVIALVQMKYGGIGVYTYFPYTKTQCADSGAPVLIDTWSKTYDQFTRKRDLYDRKKKVYNLYGCPLKCAGIHRPPDSIIEETGNKTYNLSGIGGLLFETVAVKMNFTPIITRVADVTSNYDAIYNNDSSPIAIDVATKKADIGFGIFTRLLDYHPQVALVKETNMDCFTWAVPADAGVGQSMWTTYIGEFSIVTWLLIYLILILAVMIFYILARLSFSEDPAFTKWDVLCFYVYFTFLGASVEEKPRSNIVRSFLAPWLFYCLVLIAAYNAQLGSFATVPTKSGNIEDTTELLHTKFSVTGTPQMYYVLNASVKTSYAIKMLLKRFEVLPPGNFLPVVKKVAVSRNTAVFSTKSLLAYTNDRLKAQHLAATYLQPECVIKSPSSPVIVRRVSPLREPLSAILHRLFEAGILSRWENQAKQQSIIDTFQHEPKLYMEQMQGAFLLLISGLVLSMIVFAAEHIVHRWIRPPPDLLTQLIAQGYTIPYTN